MDWTFQQPSNTLRIVLGTTITPTVTSISETVNGNITQFKVLTSAQSYVGSIVLITANTLIFGFVTWLPTFFVSQGLSISKSFASMLPWMDRLFGTHHLPARDWPSAYGIDSELPATLVGQLIHPFRPQPEPTATDPAAISPR